MEGKEWEGCVCRIRKCVSELLSMEEDLIDDDDEESEDSWDIIGRDLQLKAAFLYCDLSRVIASARDEHKMALTDLGNKLFHFMEELDHAVKSRSVSLTQICYSDTTRALKELVSALQSSY
uniref:Photosynthetic NDH subunit of lumenal location 3, chloroplastic n=1 Tax=Ananas comosus var. bracteatus TaxID=296719 RepID=A0A6V7QKH2_ANACO|nr:unnamed protein product [Ananas comosus var. bracteatus]